MLEQPVGRSDGRTMKCTSSASPRRGHGVLVCLLLFSTSALLAQDAHQKKEIAIFALQYASWPVPGESVVGVDREIEEVFVNLARFRVIGMAYRLNQEDVGSFIETIRGYKEQNVEIPEEVQMGEEFFTQADLNRLVGSFIVVVPSVTYFSIRGDQQPGKKPSYTVKLQTSFSFIGVSEMQTFAQFTIDTAGENTSRQEAARDAIAEIPQELSYRIRSIPELKLSSGVLEIRGNEILMDLGRTMGLMVGDEYAVLATRAGGPAGTYTAEKGLIIVKRVDEETSAATVLYADEEIEIGDRLREIARFGLDTNAYLHVVAGGGFPTMFGIRQSITRGLYLFRPVVGVEVPVHLWNIGGLPLNVYAGGEADIYLNRFQLIPMVTVGLGGSLPLRDGEEFGVTHVGGSVSVVVAYLFARDMRITAELGYLSWFDVRKASERLRDRSYGGILLGTGVSIRY